MLQRADFFSPAGYVKVLFKRCIETEVIVFVRVASKGWGYIYNVDYEFFPKSSLTSLVAPRLGAMKNFTRNSWLSALGIHTVFSIITPH